MGMSGGRPTANGKLWQFECGCIEGFYPYALYPCVEHRRESEPIYYSARAAGVLMSAMWALGFLAGWLFT